mmetsp:Transcript_31636/g.60361  ORF Transcript_31636/g.60361 Transcript_31636/m.60361 type:complete len:234 (+) Transcript_31636:78-779(+)
MTSPILFGHFPLLGALFFYVSVTSGSRCATDTAVCGPGLLCAGGSCCSQWGLRQFDNVMRPRESMCWWIMLLSVGVLWNKRRILRRGLSEWQLCTGNNLRSRKTLPCWRLLLSVGGERFFHLHVRFIFPFTTYSFDALEKSVQYCGTTADYCGAGCQSNCTLDDVICGPDNPCANDHCCSKWGHCGTTEDYCGEGCQSGNCDPEMTCGPEKPCDNGNCCSKWGVRKYLLAILK